MKEKQILQIQNSQASFIECINYNNQNYLFFYDQYLKINKYLVLEQQKFCDCQIFKNFSYLDNTIQVIKCYNQIERKWKHSIKHFQGFINHRNIKNFHLKKIQTSINQSIKNEPFILYINIKFKQIDKKDLFLRLIYQGYLFQISR
ncbi:unnamed protein product [Paramecium pentaurelia]|uniref:Uncharacterized protein n=1 Tax=Paramecium pentaurelia TaxID=43138 RepID=A0A8S1UP76_9CILI|nr:unnamed protein product [Paramecium pentaurelia]